MSNGSHVTASPSRLSRRFQGRPWERVPTWLAIFVLGLSLYLLTLPADLRNNGDAVYRFFVTRRLLHGLTSVACGATTTDTRLATGRHGCLYTIYAPGQSVLMVPLYLVGKLTSLATGLPADFTTAISARALDPILGSLVLVMFCLLAQEVGYRHRTAMILTLILAFASTLWPDVQSGQEQVETTLALLVVVYSGLRAIQASREAALKEQSLSFRWSGSPEYWLVVSGAATGFGLFTRYDFAVDTVVICAWLVYTCLFSGPRSTPNSQPSLRIPWVRMVGPFGIGLIPFAVIDGLWNTIRFGAPWHVGESASAQFGFPVWQGIPNLLISPGKGLIWYVPLLWLLPFVARRFWTRAPQLAWLVAGLVIASVFFYAGLNYWHGDPAWGPRYLFPLVPLLVLPLGELCERFAAFRIGLRGFAIAALTLSLALQLAAVSVDPWRFWYNLVSQRMQAAQLFQMKPQSYRYYWSTKLSFDPELYQFTAVKDVADIALGNKDMAFGPRPANGSSLSRADIAQLDGVAKRPLNTVSPIWLNDRYQWIQPLPVPLSLVARAIILAVLATTAAAGALILHLQFWNDTVKGQERN